MLKGNKTHGFGPVHLKHLQLRISRQWFTRQTLLNAHILNFMGRVILLDHQCQSLAKFTRQMKICSYSPIPVT